MIVTRSFTSTWSASAQRATACPSAMAAGGAKSVPHFVYRGALIAIR
jgi:hypothetical protein